MRLTRRDLLLTLSAATLCRCSDARYSAVGAASADLWSDLNVGTVSWEAAEKVPYASLAVRAGDAPERLAILAEDRAGTLSWSVGRSATLLTRGGRIVGWYDGEAVMIDASGGAGDPMQARAVHTVPPGSCVRQLDFPQDRHYGVVVRSRFADTGTGTLAGRHGPRIVRNWVEQCQADGLDWRFRNEFHRDEASGEALGSLQSIHPALDPIAVRVLRPYAAQKS